MLLFLMILVVLSWGLVTFVAWLLSIVFGVALTLVWVLKVWIVLMLLGFLWDIFTSYKGNMDWY